MTNKTTNPNNLVAYQGEPGAFSDLACQHCLRDMERLPCTRFEDAFAAVQDKRAALAMIAIENSVAGRVADTYHLMRDTGLHIIAEHFEPIHHQLLAVSGATLATIRTVYSHVHALGQCRNFIRDNGLTAIVADDTAGAAAMVAERGDRTVAAIASELAGKIYHLSSVSRNIEDAAHNTTRFLVLSREKKWAPLGGVTVTTFVFSVRNVPAALYKALGGFATNAINMTKLESYMVDGNFTATEFYADVEAHPKERRLKLAFEELEFFSRKFEILGVYPAAKERTEPGWGLSNAAN